MDKKLQILTVCGLGVGSSIFLKLNIEKILEEKHISAVVDASDVYSAPSSNADLIFTAKEYQALIADKTTIPVFSIGNFLNKKEVEESLLNALSDLEGMEH